MLPLDTSVFRTVNSKSADSQSPGIRTSIRKEPSEVLFLLTSEQEAEGDDIINRRQIYTEYYQ